VCWFRKNQSWFSKDRIQVERDFPRLHFYIFKDSILILRGSIDLNAEETSADSYEIQIIFPPEYPSEIPFVRETAGRILRIPDRHIYAKEGFFCIGPRLAIKESWDKNHSIVRFLNEFVIPFLANQSYYERMGEWKNGDYDHGKKGILQYYRERFNINDEKELMLILNNIVSGVKVGRNDRCFCESGKKAKKCHLDITQDLQRLGHRNIFLEDIKNLLGDSKTSENQDKQAADITTAPTTASTKLAP